MKSSKNIKVFDNWIAENNNAHFLLKYFFLKIVKKRLEFFLFSKYLV